MPKNKEAANVSPLEIAALSAAFSKSKVDAAKKSLTPGCYNVDRVFRVHGTVNRGADSPGSCGTAPANVDLQSLPMICELLRRLKVEPKQVRTALRAMVRAAKKQNAASIGAECVKPLPEFVEVFTEETAAAVAALPERKTTSNGKAGATSAALTVEILT